jgi:membrane dipeptidase
MKPLRGTILVLLILAVISWFEVPSIVESRNNKLLNPPPYHTSAGVQALHNTLIVADLHSDSLLWDRNLLKRSSRGHVDLPRLQDGNVSIQAFTLVTTSPRHLSYAWR